MTPIHGTTDPRFQAVRDAFAANFRDHGELGAALCVYLRGRRVVDLWGGIADLTTGAPWAEDTLQYVFSTTKGFTATCAHLLVQRGELDLDAYIGLPPAHQHRVGRLIEPPAASPADFSALRRASAVTTPRIDPNDPRVHAAEIPSSNGITTARALARFYNALIDPAEGYPLLTPTTLTTATTAQSDGLDQTLGVPTRFGLGYALPSTTFALFGADSIGHGGRGGSLGCAHPPTRTTVGYVMNRMHTGLTTDRRFTNLATAIATSL